MKLVLVAIVLGLDDDGPSCWKDVLVQIQLNRLKEVASEDGLDAQVLSIGQMDNRRSWGHASVSPGFESRRKAIDAFEVP